MSGRGQLLTDTEVSVNRGIASGTGQVLILAVGDMEVGLGITVFLGQTEIDDVDLVATFANAHEEVVRFDIAVDEGLGVDVLDTRYELIGEQQDRLEGELAVAEVEEIFERGAEQVEDHGVVITLGAKPSDEGDADAAGKGFVDAGLIFELRVFGFDAFELDGDLLAGDDVGTLRRRSVRDVKRSRELKRVIPR